MLFRFLMKKLVTDTSSEEIRRVTSLLKQSGIKYEIRTVKPRGGIGTAMDSRAYANVNLAMYKGASLPAFVYMVYVNRRDVDRAREVIAA